MRKTSDDGDDDDNGGFWYFAWGWELGREVEQTLLLLEGGEGESADTAGPVF